MSRFANLELDADVDTPQPRPLTRPTPIGRIEVGNKLYVGGATRQIVERTEDRGSVRLVCDDMLILDYRSDREVDLVVEWSGEPLTPDSVVSDHSMNADDCHIKVIQEQNDELAQGRSLREVSDTITAEIVQENRSSVEVELGDCDIDYLGRLTRATDAHDPLVLLDRAHKGLTDKAPNTALCPSNLREWMPESKAKVVLRTLHMPATKRRDAGTAAFATLSGRYVEADMHVLADLLAKALPDDTTATYKYQGDGGRWQVRATLTRPWDIAVGDDRTEPHQAVLLLRGYDNGAGSIQLRFGVVRRTCTNGMTTNSSPVNRTIRHLGDHESVLNELHQAFGSVDESMSQYAARWHGAYGSVFRGLVERDGVYANEPISGLEALRRLMSAKLLPTGGRRRKSVWNAYKEAFEAEPGDSTAHVVNAVTRWAHEGAITKAGRWIPSVWAQDDVEEAADQVFAYIHRALPAVQDEHVEWFS